MNHLTVGLMSATKDIMNFIYLNTDILVKNVVILVYLLRVMTHFERVFL